MAAKSSFLDKVLGRIERLDAGGLQEVIQRLASERSFLETLFNTIEDGVLVVDADGRILYFNEAVTQLIGMKASDAEGRPVMEYLPELDWEKLFRADMAGGQRVIRHEFEVNFPRPRFLRLYAAPLDGAAAGSSGLANAALCGRTQLSSYCSPCQAIILKFFAGFCLDRRVSV